MIIKVYPNIQREFTAEKRRAVAEGRESFVYRDTTLYFEKRENGKLSTICYCLLESLTQPLPQAFSRGYLRVKVVDLQDELPKNSSVSSGLYCGRHFGFRIDVLCSIRRDTKPYVRVSGPDLTEVIGLYKKVMTGKFTPAISG